MTSTKNHTALISQIEDNLYIGIVIEVPGAASFAKTKKELITRLYDAAKCIEEANKIEVDSKPELKEVFFEHFKMFGEPTKESIPCAL